MKMLPVFLTTLMFVLHPFVTAQSTEITIEQKIRDDTELSEFYDLLKNHPVATNILNYRHVTVFAPTNRAFQTFNMTSENLVLYHMSNLHQTTDQLGDSISSELDGNPPLWVTRKPRGSSSRDEEIYINNAKIEKSRSNFVSKIKVKSDVKTQVLHIISEVLEPVHANSRDSPIYNPNAFQFLNQSENLNLGKHRVRTFRQRITLTNKESIFKAEGRYTFFIPVEDGFKPNPRSNKIDHLVIDGHVIPNHVLFTAPTPNDKPYETLAFSDNLKVTISFTTEQTKEGAKVYVKSDTRMGDSKHPTGVVLAEIVKANIPVRNGVIHLIQRPLMVIDTTVKEFLEEKEDGPVYKFYEAILDLGDDLLSTITNLRNVTLFAPSNAAFEDPGVKLILQDKKRLREIMNLHYVKQTLPLDVIESRTVVQVSRDRKGHYAVPTAADRKSLYFNVVQGPHGNKTVTVEGGGVNATIITPNIAATNGIIHIIDRVLGVPYTTVLAKLRTDPMLNSTYVLGHQRSFNDQLGNSDKRFTYFAPSEDAWRAAGIRYPSTHKKLFMPEFSYHAQQILERHLIVANEPLTIAKIKEMSRNESYVLPSFRDTLKLRFKNNTDVYQMEWQGKWIKVLRPDVECTNGVIHVIDSVLLLDSDVQVTGGGSSSLAAFAPHLIMMVIVKWLL